MRYLNNFKLFENIQQGKSILNSKNIQLSDPQWLRLLQIFDKNPGYIGDFTYLVFNKNWHMHTVQYLYTDFIDNQSNKPLFNKLYPEIKNYENEEKFIDDLLKLKRERDIKNVYNKFPSTQKDLIDSISKKSKEKLLNDLSLRKDINVFIRKISRYHSIKDLVDAIKLFLSSEIIDAHDKIIKKLKEMKVPIIRNDESNNLIIIKVDYPQLRVLASHTSWCILSEGTFDNYNKICDQFIIYLTDLSGNESMIGATIGENVKTAHYINDRHVDSLKLKEILKERGFDLSKLYMTKDQYLKKLIDKESLSTLLKLGYNEDEIFKVRNIFHFYDFKNISEIKIKKYDIKCKDSGAIGYQMLDDLFKNDRLVDIGYHLLPLYKKFGDKIIPFIDPKYDFSKFSPSIIELVEKIEDRKFTSYDEILKRINDYDEHLISFLIKREIPFEDNKIAYEIMKQGEYHNDYLEILKIRPQLFEYLYNKIQYLDSKQLIEISKLDYFGNNEKLSKLIKDRQRAEASKYVNGIVPSPQYQNMGIGRRESMEFLKKMRVNKFGVNEFMSDDIWGKIKEQKLYYEDRNRYVVYAFMSCTKLNRLDDLKFLFPLSYESVGRIIRSAMYRKDSKYGYFYNGKSIITDPFILNDKEEEKLFEWMLVNMDENSVKSNVSNQIYDKSLGRHKLFSVIYYKYGWGFERYMDIVSKVKPIENSIWSKNNKGENMVQYSITRPELMSNVISYLGINEKEEELLDLCEKLMAMKLRQYEIKSLYYTIPYKLFEGDFGKKFQLILKNYSYNFNYSGGNYGNGYSSEFSLKKV